MKTVSKTFQFIIAFILSFGFWFLLGWFISSEIYLFAWPSYGKIFYLFFSFILWIKILDEFGWDFKTSDNTSNTTN